MNNLSMLPPVFLERLEAIVPKDKKQAVYASFSVKRPTSIRVNTLKVTPKELVSRLQTYGFRVAIVPWNKVAYLVDTTDVSCRLTDIAEYIDGLFYVQSVTSMLPAMILNPLPEEKILDIAAAPGSKTTQIASMMRNTGEIVANDISHERLYKLRANIKQQGVSNTKITNIPGQIFWKKFPEYFDKSLVDAPCSLEGRISLLDPKSYAGWSPKKIEILSNRERYLLRSAISATKVGGTIVYSTCTLSPEENEGVINWILEKEKGKVILEEANIDGILKDKAITSWKKKTYSDELQKTLRILPSETMEGFFVAKFTKISSSF